MREPKLSQHGGQGTDLGDRQCTWYYPIGGCYGGKNKRKLLKKKKRQKILRLTGEIEGIFLKREELYLSGGQHSQHVLLPWERFLGQISQGSWHEAPRCWEGHNKRSRRVKHPGREGKLFK